jgi:hypothetical protein
LEVVPGGAGRTSVRVKGEVDAVVVVDSGETVGCGRVQVMGRNTFDASVRRGGVLRTVLDQRNGCTIACIVDKEQIGAFQTFGTNKVELQTIVDGDLGNTQVELN